MIRKSNAESSIVTIADPKPEPIVIDFQINAIVGSFPKVGECPLMPVFRAAFDDLVAANTFAGTLLQTYPTLAVNPNKTTETGGKPYVTNRRGIRFWIESGATMADLYPDLWERHTARLEAKRARLLKQLADTVGAAQPAKAKGKSRDEDGHRTKTKAKPRGEDGRWLKAA